LHRTPAPGRRFRHTGHHAVTLQRCRHTAAMPSHWTPRRHTGHHAVTLQRCRHTGHHAGTLNTTPAHWTPHRHTEHHTGTGAMHSN